MYSLLIAIAIAISQLTVLYRLFIGLQSLYRPSYYAILYSLLITISTKLLIQFAHDVNRYQKSSFLRCCPLAFVIVIMQVNI